MPQQTFYSTRGVAGLLGVRPGRISQAVWDGRIAEPQRGPGDNFLWTEDDIARAARVFGMARPSLCENGTTCSEV